MFKFVYCLINWFIIEITLLHSEIGKLCFCFLILKEKKENTKENIVNYLILLLVVIAINWSLINPYQEMQKNSQHCIQETPQWVLLQTLKTKEYNLFFKIITLCP